MWEDLNYHVLNLVVIPLIEQTPVFHKVLKTPVKNDPV